MFVSIGQCPSCVVCCYYRRRLYYEKITKSAIVVVEDANNASCTITALALLLHHPTEQKSKQTAHILSQTIHPAARKDAIQYKTRSTSK